MRGIGNYRLKPEIHQFTGDVFGSTTDLLAPPDEGQTDTLLIACSEQGTGPDYVSCAGPERIVTIQHLAGSMPSRRDCQKYFGLSCDGVEKLFDKHEFRHVILCGHLDSKVIPYWLADDELQPAGSPPRNSNRSDVGYFRQRFEQGTRDLVDNNYLPSSSEERCRLMIFEHVLCQVENMLTHPFVMKRVFTKRTSFHAWVADNQSPGVFGYDPKLSAFSLL